MGEEVAGTWVLIPAFESQVEHTMGDVGEARGKVVCVVKPP